MLYFEAQSGSQLGSSVLLLSLLFFVQGVQAQTVANFLLAFEAGLSVVPVINKVGRNFY